MKVEFTQIEIVVLTYNMAIMRNNIKKVLKSNYGKSNGKELLTIYDNVKRTFENYCSEEEGEVNEIDFSIQELNVLKSFISSYVNELETTFQKAGYNPTEEDQYQIDTLNAVKSKIEELEVQ